MPVTIDSFTIIFDIFEKVKLFFLESLLFCEFSAFFPWRMKSTDKKRSWHAGTGDVFIYCIRGISLAAGRKYNNGFPVKNCRQERFYNSLGNILRMLSAQFCFFHKSNIILNIYPIRN
ncbi:MAG: hypothetical protein GX485_01610 [Clostridiales bacterium]|nr:hypothetical protein [Clostridiales bacterium]